MVMSDRSLFTPDALLPSQFFVTLRGQAQRTPPEFRLLIAVLEDALECFQKYVRATSRGKRRLFVEAEQWIMSERRTRRSRADATVPAFSFEYVCDVLDIEPDCIRGTLRRWLAAQDFAPTASERGGGAACVAQRRRFRHP